MKKTADFLPAKNGILEGATIFMFSESVELALEFFFLARSGNLEKEQRELIQIKNEYLRTRCERVEASRINIDSSGDTRIVFIGTNENYDNLFRVVLCKRPGKEWRVVGFHYPRDDQGHYYAVFEPHAYWFGWREKSDYLRSEMLPDY